jgi:hypothetical protein|tara:strand:- start:3529 stop:3744 length:216 start_codon:yes stop_codon:yes gene_type:complete
MPEIFGYGIFGTGTTPEKAMKALKKIFYKSKPERTWKKSIEYWEIKLTKIHEDGSFFDGNADYIDYEPYIK